MAKTKLADFLKEVINWEWDQYVKAEKSKEAYSSNQAIVFALIRSCAMQQIDSIKIALNRLDGKLKTPIQVELPKVYFLYPNAKLHSGDTPDQKQLSTPLVPNVDNSTNSVKPVEGEIVEEKKPDSDEQKSPFDDVPLEELGLRETLSKMGDYPSQLPEAIMQRALEVEQAIRNRTPLPDEIPKVKSVVVAHLIILGQKRNIEALYELFDQIDGKLAETIQILGEDIYITSYASQAPPEAVLNEDGVLQLEASQSQQIWADKLNQQGGR